MTYRVLQIPVGPMANFTYIIADEENSEEAAVIDPSWDLDKVFSALKKNGWKAKYVINTHGHFDHVIGNDQIPGALAHIALDGVPRGAELVAAGLTINPANRARVAAARRIGAADPHVARAARRRHRIRRA